MALPETYIDGFHDKDAVEKTRYHQLGNTDMFVSKLGFGGAVLGGVYGVDQGSTGVVEEAIRLGVNYIDTAYWYGQGKSEIELGKALSGVPRDAYYIATKIGRYEKEIDKMFDFSAEKTFTSIEGALTRLQVPYVDVIQIHDVEFAPSVEYICNVTLPAVQKIKESGKARYIGITGYPLRTLKEIVEQSTVKIDTILSYNRGVLHDSTLSEYVEYFNSKGIGIINASPVSMGILSDSGPQPWHPGSSALKEKCRDANQYCKEHSVSLAELALFYSMNIDHVATTLSGCSTKSMLMQNLAVSWKTNLPTDHQKVMDYLRREYFPNNEKDHWEGVELESFKTQKTS